MGGQVVNWDCVGSTCFIMYLFIMHYVHAVQSVKVGEFDNWTGRQTWFVV